MPHITLEYTANLSENPPTRELLLSLHHLLQAMAGIRIENCKSRWRKVEDWVVDLGEENLAFVHLDLRFLEGRTEEIQRAVGQGALDALKAHFHPGPEGVDLQITVEVGEIRKESYFKDPPGTLGGPQVKLV